jgi:hypothetical protein
MLSSVLTSARAIEVNIAIMRAFVMLRRWQTETQDLQKTVDLMRDQYDQLFDKYDQQFEIVFQALDNMLAVKNEKRKTTGRLAI